MLLILFYEETKQKRNLGAKLNKIKKTRGREAYLPLTGVDHENQEQIAICWSRCGGLGLRRWRWRPRLKREAEDGRTARFEVAVGGGEADGGRDEEKRRAGRAGGNGSSSSGSKRRRGELASSCR